jgi:hypothetical protein
MAHLLEKIPFSHGQKLYAKLKNEKNSELRTIVERYQEFLDSIDKLEVLDEVSVHKFVDSFNKYRNNVVYALEDRPNSGQENLRSSMLEEFFQRLLKDEILKALGDTPRNVVLGKADSYVDLAFSPESFKKLFEKPSFYIHTKDQDFVIGAGVTIGVSVGDVGEKKDAVIPVVAIECKTYIESNMLDSCAGTAARLKSAMPYCMYFVAAEYMKMETARPELTDIDEVFILCKATNSERERRKKERALPHEIDRAVVWDLFREVDRHLRKIWWDPANALKNGRIIGRPY